MNPFADTLHMTVRASAMHRVFVVALHALAATVWLGLLTGRFWLLPLGVVLLVSFVLCWRDAGLARSHSVRRLRWHAGGRWQWQTRRHGWRDGRLIGSYVWADTLVVLRLKPDEARWFGASLVLFADALNADTHRHLRARLTIAADGDTPTPIR